MIETTQIISYIATLGLAAAIPGPGMTALVARSVSGGVVTGFSVLAGLILGDLIYLSTAIFGLAALSHIYSSFSTLVNWAASIYLCVLAWKFYCHQPQAISVNQKATQRELASAWFAGLTITLANPKTIAFYLAIVPLVISLDTVSVRMWGTVLVPLTVLVLLGVGAIFILAALRIRRFLTSAKSQRRLFQAAGLIMMLAAFSMMARAL